MSPNRTHRYKGFLREYMFPYPEMKKKHPTGIKPHMLTYGLTWQKNTINAHKTFKPLLCSFVINYLGFKNGNRGWVPTPYKFINPFKNTN